MRSLPLLPALWCLATFWGLGCPAAGDALILGVPDWNQPKDYGVVGYPQWCAPTAAASLVGYWEDRFGLIGLADRQRAPAETPYPNNPGIWMQGLYHDGTIELGWFLGTGDWLGNDGPFPPYTGGTVFEPFSWIGTSVLWYAEQTWTDPTGLEKLSFPGGSTYQDRVRGQAMWTNYMAEIDAGRPVVSGFSGWVGIQQGTATVGTATVHLYGFGTRDAHAVTGVGYIDPTPKAFNGDEWIIAQDNWPQTPQYVAVPVDNHWLLNEYITLAVPVPEPSTSVLLALGSVGLSALAFRRRHPKRTGHPRAIARSGTPTHLC